MMNVTVTLPWRGWVIRGPACPVVITLVTLPGGVLTMRITDAATGASVAPPSEHQSYGLTPEQCDQFEDALRAARELREPEPR